MRGGEREREGKGKWGENVMEGKNKREEERESEGNEGVGREGWGQGD